MTDVSTLSKAPMSIDVEEGKNYYWCSCGKSTKMPLCDGAHKGSEFAPLKHTATKTETIYMCGCQKTTKPPFCDGTHKAL